MTKAELAMNANPVVAFLQKPTEEFTKADIIRFIEANEVKMVNFMYPADDGKLKTLNFVITNRDYLETILSVSTARACSHSSRREAVTCMCCRVSARRSSTRSQKSRRSACCAVTSTKTAIRSHLLPRTRCARRAAHSARQREWSSMRWASSNTTS